MPTQEVLTWAQFDNAVDIIVEKLRVYEGQFDSIYGIPRGGLVLAVALSHRLGVPLANTCHQDSLVVDDISDSGNTLFPFQRRGHVIATIHLVPATRVHPDIWVYVRRADWVTYPWEKGGNHVDGSS